MTLEEALRVYEIAVSAQHHHECVEGREALQAYRIDFVRTYKPEINLNDPMEVNRAFSQEYDRFRKSIVSGVIRNGRG